MPNPNAAASLTPEYFEHVYGANADPWNFTGSEYEAGKYAATLAVLPRPKYQHAFEAGCSIGVLTQQLSTRCERLLAMDVSAQALDAARARCAAQTNIRFIQATLPNQFPLESFDLILISEVGYYLAMPDLLALRAHCLRQLTPRGHLLLVHWTPPVHDYPLTGDEVHDAFLAMCHPTGSELIHRAGQRAEKYRLDLFERSAPPAAVPPDAA